MKNVFITLLFLNISIINGQDVLGKWVLIITDTMPMTMEPLVMEISKTRIKIYDFDKLILDHKIKINTDNKIIKYGKGENESKFSYKMKDSITMTRQVNYQSNEIGNWKVKYWNYVKLFPTQINYPVDSILSKQYNRIYPRTLLTPHNILKLEGRLCDDPTAMILGNDNCPRYRLEKIDKTYFITYQWKKNYRKWVFPVKEINKDYLIVYGVYEKEGFVKLHEIKEIIPVSSFIRNH